MSNYLIELAVIHTALMLGYCCCLRHEQQYGKMRFYLIGTSLLALLIPLLKLPRLFDISEEPLPAMPMQSISVGRVTVSPETDTTFWNLDLLLWLYAAVSLFFLCRLLANVYYLIALERKSTYEKYDTLYVRRLSSIQGSFTFFNWIFLSSEIDKQAPEYAVILKHENAHARLGHSYDILFFELFRVCFWWLPTAWYLIYEIKKIHEYQADAYALKSYHLEQYSSILISSTLKTNGLSLASSFHDGLIIKRLIAMKKQAKNVSPWKVGALSVLAAALFVVFACTEEMDQDIEAGESQSSQSITFDQLPAEMQKRLIGLKDKASIIRVDLPEGVDFNFKMIPEYDSGLLYLADEDIKNHVAYVFALKNTGEIDLTEINYIALYNIPHEEAASKNIEGEEFTIVEDQPQYPGGMDAFYNYVGQQIRYPLEAQQAEVEGTVYVQFVVEKDGTISNVETVKGIGAGCDEEAVRVIQQAENFQPGSQRGKKVRVRMVMPIEFRLYEAKLMTNNSTAGIVIVNEVASNNGKLKVDASFKEGVWSGTVYDEEGKALPGVNIVVAGTSTGTVSDLDGTFTVSADASHDLNLSFVGYESIKLAGK